MQYVKAINRYEKQTDNSYNVEGKAFGKITGTSLAGIIGESPWSTPFSIATKILRIYDEDVDNSAVRAGKMLEPIMLNYLDKSGRLENTQAEVLFPEYEKGRHMDWKSHFEDEVFSGHIDAIAGHVTDAYKGTGIVENKTTAKPEMWDFVNNIPPKNYWLQASLYVHFFGYDTIYFTVGILTPEEQENPYKFIPSEDNVKVMKVGLYPGFDEILKTARDWYYNYIEHGHTPVPDMDNPIDAHIVNILDAQNSTVNDILPLFNEYLELTDEINVKQKRADDLKERICAYLEANDIRGIGNGKTSYKYAEYSRTAIDNDALKRDGLYDTYLKKSSYMAFRKGKF